MPTRCSHPNKGGMRKTCRPHHRRQRQGKPHKGWINLKLGLATPAPARRNFATCGNRRGHGGCDCDDLGNGVMKTGFSVVWRNYGHWDIVSNKAGRLFRLRGGPSEWIILDERSVEERKERMVFKEQSAAMSYVCAELMHELLTIEGQAPYTMEFWNISRKEPKP